ncbi:hypothetical protein EI94DRAFT_1733931, partial [Lactarius quietus]
SSSEKYLKKLVGRTDIEDGLKKLDNLIQGEHGMATVQVLKATAEVKDILKELLLAVEELTKREGQEEYRPDPSTNHNIACKAYHEGTSMWTEMSRGSLLWVHGKLGSGKSILCSAIICHLSAFWGTCCDAISLLYSTHGNGTRNPTNDDLTKCLKQMVSVLAEHPIYIVMDTLNKCPNNSRWPKTPREEVLDVVQELIDLHLLNFEQKKGTANYVSTIVNSDRKMQEWPDEDKELVIKELSERLENLQQLAQQNVQGILSKLPKTLDETYEHMLRDTHEDNKEHAHHLLHCLAFAIWPLRVEELAEILTFDFDKGNIPEHHTDWCWKDQEEAVLSTCSSLITMAEYFGSDDNNDNNDNDCHSRMWVVQFSHFSVKEFLMLNHLAIPIRHVSWYHILPRDTHTILAQAYLRFLLHLDGHTDPQTAKGFPLAKYAAKYWVAHAQIQEVALHMKCGMRHLLDLDKPHFALWVGIHNVDKPFVQFGKHTQPTPLYYSTLCGLLDIAKDLAIKYPQHGNAIGGQYNLLLVVTLSGSHFSVMELLLEHGVNINVCGTEQHTPLHTLLCCCEDKDFVVQVQLLLEHSTDINAQDMAASSHETPLHLAVHEAHLSDIICVLLNHGADPNLENLYGKIPLQCGADVNAQDKCLKTPLHLAVQLERSDLTQILLDHEQRWQTPLHMLLGLKEIYSSSIPKHHHADYILVMVQLLLERGADVNAWDKCLQTPLLLTMKHKTSSLLQIHHVDHILIVAQLLLEGGTDVNAQDKSLETPLLLVQHKMSDLPQFLLENGADSNVENKDGRTPLHMLLGLKEIHNGSTSEYDGADYILIVAQLLDHGPDVNARDKHHKTPLLLAMQHKITVQILTLKNEDDNTPLHHASQNGMFAITQVLLEHGGKPNAKGKDCETSLHLTLQGKGDSECDIGITRLHLEHGANVNVQDNFHVTPSDLSSRLQRPEIANVLENRKTRARSHKADFSSEVTSKHIRLGLSKDFSAVPGENIHHDSMEL